MAKNKKHVIQIYLDDNEYEFLIRASKVLRRTYAQTIMYFADFKQRMIEEAEEDVMSSKVIIKGMEMPDNPFDDLEEGY
jgi:hypothetical protein